MRTSNRIRLYLLAFTAASSMLSAACSSEAPGTDDEAISGAKQASEIGTSPEAGEIADSMARAFRLASLTHVNRPARPGITSAHRGIDPALAPPELAGVERLGANELSTRLTSLDDAARRLVVRLPARASGPFHLDDRGSSAAIDVALEGASDAGAELASGLVVYRDGLAPGAHVIHRVTAEGTEDYVMLEAAIAPSLAYSLELRRGIAGLRLVANTLEMVDADGMPRLRVPPPYVLGADGTRHDATLAVEGCSFDTNPAAPWDHAVIPAGSTHCRVVVSWSNDGLSYPAFVDPSWTITANMITKRSGHTAESLPSGSVLVVGGTDSTGFSIASTELYNPVTNLWAAGASMAFPRATHTSTKLSTGNVVIIGGTSASRRAEIYTASSGLWSTTSDSGVYRQEHAASLLADGTILVTGGQDFVSGLELATASRFDPAAGTWTSMPSMSIPHWHHTSTTLSTNDVLIAGGYTSGAGVVLTKVCQLYTFSSGTWASTGPMEVARAFHTATLLPTSGLVLAAGGTTPLLSPVTARAILYNPAVGSWTTGSIMPVARAEHTATLLNTGKVLLAGGFDGVNVLASTALYTPSTNAWAASTTMWGAHDGHTATLLTISPYVGHVLVAAGVNAAASPIWGTERYTP